MNMQTLYQYFINEKELSIQMLHDMSFMDISLFEWKFCNDIIVKLCYGKNSLLTQITLKKIPLTANDRDIINNIFTVVFEKSQIFELVKLHNPFGKLIVDHNINSATKNNFEMILFDILSEVGIVHKTFGGVYEHIKNKQLMKILFGEHLILNNIELDDLDDCIVGILDAVDIAYKGRLQYASIFLVSKCTNINRFNMLCYSHGNSSRIIRAFDVLKTLNIYPNSMTFRCLAMNDTQSSHQCATIATHFLNNGFTPDLECIEVLIRTWKFDSVRKLLLSKIDFTTIEFNKVYSLMGPLAYTHKPDLSINDFEYMFEKLHIIRHNYDDIIIGMLNRLDIPDPTKYIKYAIKHFSLNIIQALINKGAVLDNQCFVIACTTIEISEQLLNLFINHKLFINIDCFKSFINACSKHIIQKKNNKLNYQDTILTLVGFGLVIDLECINYMLKKGLFLSGLETFDIAYNENLYKLCNENNYFPSEYLEKFIISIGKYKIMLRNMFLTECLEIIEKYMNEYKLEIDDICLYNALHYNPNCIQIFTKFNYTPNMKDILYIKSDKQKELIYETYFDKQHQTIKLL